MQAERQSPIVSRSVNWWHTMLLNQSQDAGRCNCEGSEPHMADRKASLLAKESTNILYVGPKLCITKSWDLQLRQVPNNIHVPSQTLNISTEAVRPDEHTYYIPRNYGRHGVNRQMPVNALLAERHCNFLVVLYRTLIPYTDCIWLTL